MCRRDVRIGWDENGLTLCLLESSGVWIESAEQANGAGGAHVPEAYEAGFRRFPFSIARGFGVWKNGARRTSREREIADHHRRHISLDLPVARGNYWWLE